MSAPTNTAHPADRASRLSQRLEFLAFLVVESSEQRFEKWTPRRLEELGSQLSECAREACEIADQAMGYVRRTKGGVR